MPQEEDGEEHLMIPSKENVSAMMLKLRLEGDSKEVELTMQAATIVYVSTRHRQHMQVISVSVSFHLRS